MQEKETVQHQGQIIIDDPYAINAEEEKSIAKKYDEQIEMINENRRQLIAKQKADDERNAKDLPGIQAKRNAKEQRRYERYMKGQNKHEV